MLIDTHPGTLIKNTQPTAAPAHGKKRALREAVASKSLEVVGCTHHVVRVPT